MASLVVIGDYIDALPWDRKGRHQREALLPERHPVYRGLTPGQAARIRGYLLIQLARYTLPKMALPYVLEGLDSGRDAYLVAAAARAVRSIPNLSASWAPHLLQALVNMRYHNDSVILESLSPNWETAETTSPIREILVTLARMGKAARQSVPLLEDWQEAPFLSPEAQTTLKDTLNSIRQGEDTEKLDCCTLPEARSLVRNLPWQQRRLRNRWEAVGLEDQSGNALVTREFFKGQPSVMAFFYSRCMNPHKCSLTINQLGQLQRQLESAGLANQIRIGAITYDPAYDTPTRIRTFGENRGLQFNDNARAFRTTLEGLDVVSDYMNLGVNFDGATVNQHQVELYLLDAQGRVIVSYTRQQWNPSDVLEDLRTLLQPRPLSKKVLHTGGYMSDGILPLLTLLLPKCPMCIVAYGSAITVCGIPALPLGLYEQVAVLAVSGLMLGALGWRAQQVHILCALIVGVISIAGLMYGAWVNPEHPVYLLGMVGLSLAAVLNAFLPWLRKRPDKTMVG